MKRMISVILALVLVLSTLYTGKAYAAPQKLTAKQTKSTLSYTVDYNDTLCGIARTLFGDERLYTELYKYNSDIIKNPDMIYRGQVLRIPEEITSYGFKLVAMDRYDSIGTEVYEYEHVRTGARVLFLVNDDVNRNFNITLRSRPHDNTGVAHVLEHSVFCGSEKYPSKDLFMNLQFQSYNSYMNALTITGFNQFPVSSYSEEELIMLADYYTDSVFHPLVLEDESLFRQEAWRYVLESPEDELTLNGTVYNEMRGEYSIYTNEILAINSVVLPGHYSQYEYGGDPYVIPDLTWQELKDFHAEYYHPSNSLIMVYGAIYDKGSILKLLDEGFRGYEKKEVSIEDENYIPLTESVDARVTVPVTMDYDVENQCCFEVDYLMDMGEAYEDMSVLISVLGRSESPFKRRVTELIPKASANAYIGGTSNTLILSFTFTGINEEDTELCKKIVEDALEEMCRDGIDEKLLQTACYRNYMDNKLAFENSDNVGSNITYYIGNYWSIYGDYRLMFQDLESLKLSTITAEELTEFVRTHLGSDTIRATVVAVPVQGGIEEKEEELKKKLADYKASLSEEEIAELIAETEAYYSRELEDNSEYVRQLTAVSVNTLPEEYRRYSYGTMCVLKENVKWINVEADVTDVGYVRLYMDISGIEQDMLHYFMLYKNLIGRLDTSKHSLNELKNLADQYLYNSTTAGGSINTANGEIAPKFIFGFYSKEENLRQAYDLVYEIFFENDYSDTEKLKAAIEKERTRAKEDLINQNLSVAMMRNLARDNAKNEFNYNVGYIPYYEFLCRVEKEFENDPDTVKNNLLKIRDYLNNRNNIVLGYVGSSEGYNVNYDASMSFVDRLPWKEITPASYEFEKLCDSEAVVTEKGTYSNTLFCTYEEMGSDKSEMGIWKVIGSLVADGYLLPVLRDMYGAYGAYMIVTDLGVMLYTLNDPNISLSYEVIRDIPEVLLSLDIDQEILDGYIMGIYSSYVSSMGEITDGIDYMEKLVGDINPDEKVAQMRKLKAFTVEDLPEYAEKLKIFVEKATKVTAGPRQLIEENRELFDRVVTTFIDK